MHDYTVQIQSRQKMESIRRETKLRTLIRDVMNARRDRDQGKSKSIYAQVIEDSHN